MAGKERGKLNVILLGIVSLLNDMSSEMIFPLLPLFIISLGGGGLAVGLIGGVMEALSHILKTASGWWSDRIKKRKPFIFTGYLASAFFKLLMSMANTWPFVLLTSSFERLGKGIRESPRDALISESMPKQMGKGFGIQRALDTLGAILGGVVVLLLFWFLGLSFQMMILIAAIIGFIALAPLYFVKDKESIRRGIKEKRFIKGKLGKISKKLKMFIFVSAIFALANFSYMFFILRAKELFPSGEKLAIAIPILLYIFFNLFYAGFAVPFGNLSDKIGRKKIIALGFLLFTLTSFGFAFFNSISWYIVLFIAYGLVYAMTYGIQRAYVADLSSEEYRGGAEGIFQTIIGVIALPASLIAGWLWTINSSYTFIYGGIIALVSFILFLLILRDKN